MPYAWSKLNPWPRKPWGFGGPSFPVEYTYGLILPQRGLRSRAWIPGPKDRMILGKQKLPYWHVMDFVLASQESQDSNILPTENFTLISIMATKTLPEDAPALPFRTQAFQLTDNQGNGVRFSSTGVNDDNFAGTAMLPMNIKRPYPAPNMLAILNRTANRSTSANTVQLVMYGVKDLEETGAVVTHA